MRSRVPLLLLGFFASASAGASELPIRYAFTTSKWGNANFASWPDAQGSGSKAADEICRARATQAGLPEPQRFVAWLSDRDDDAYCRMLGLSGKRADHCGSQEALPEAGPWFRTDGQPFAGTLAQMTDSNVVYNPLNRDEFGAQLRSVPESFTATQADGTLNTYFDEFPDCERWTSASGDPYGAFAPLGYITGTSVAWTDSGGAVSCNGTRRLACMQTGAGRPVPTFRAMGRRQAFLTEANLTGNLAGIDGADSVCRKAAQDAGLFEPGKFKALITSSAYGGSVTSRFENDGPWYRTDGVVFANSLAQIAGGEVSTPLNVTEYGTYVGYAVAMTGAQYHSDGSSGVDCSNWSKDSGMFIGSVVNITYFAPSGGHNWLGPANMDCGVPASTDWPPKLYCLSDSDVILHASFDAPQ